MVKDLDSISWYTFFEGSNDPWIGYFGVDVISSSGKTMRFTSGYHNIIRNDTFWVMLYPIPDSGEWTKFKEGLRSVWTDNANWPETDTIAKIKIFSSGAKDPTSDNYFGQIVYYDNLLLPSVAYYDYASESIDSDLPTGGKYTPVVTFANEGIKADKDAYVYAEILDGSTRVYVDSQKVSIPKESSKQITFKEWSVAGGGPFTLRTFPILDLDELFSDDTLEKSLGGVLEEGVGQFGPLKISQTSTGVEFSFAPDIGGELSIFDVCGREVFRSAINPNTSHLHWSTRGMPSGLYFAKFKSPTYSSSDKFLVIH